MLSVFENMLGYICRIVSNAACATLYDAGSSVGKENTNPCHKKRLRKRLRKQLPKRLRKRLRKRRGHPPSDPACCLSMHRILLSLQRSLMLAVDKLLIGFSYLRVPGGCCLHFYPLWHVLRSLLLDRLHAQRTWFGQIWLCSTLPSQELAHLPPQGVESRRRRPDRKWSVSNIDHQSAESLLAMGYSCNGDVQDWRGGLLRNSDGGALQFWKHLHWLYVIVIYSQIIAWNFLQPASCPASKVSDLVKIVNDQFAVSSFAWKSADKLAVEKALTMYLFPR